MPQERRRAALVRLRKYTGTEAGFKPFTELAMERVRERLPQKELLGPFKEQVERDLGNIGFFASGLDELFKKYDLPDAAPLLATLKTQFAAYEKAVRADVMPRTRTDFKLPPALYASNLEQFGVDIPPADLATDGAPGLRRDPEGDADDRRRHRPRAGQPEGRLPGGHPRAEEEAARRRRHPSPLPGATEAARSHHHRASRWSRCRRGRRASASPAAAESAQQPAPNMRPPRLVDNRGEQGEFVLPLNIPSADPAKAKQYDDFTFEAASWTLTAHEARPGHELQFAAMVEHGVSQARAIYAFNSTNVEGWGLYAEYIVKPFMPREGQLISLQHRLLRAARAFSDPELQMGATTPDKVKQLLMEDVVLSEAMATQEVERYTFRAPGQATSYFYGYSQLLGLRGEVEKLQGARFNALRFHDFVLGQGLLPPRLLRKAVMEGFVR